MEEADDRESLPMVDQLIKKAGEVQRTDRIWETALNFEKNYLENVTLGGWIGYSCVFKCMMAS